MFMTALIQYIFVYVDTLDLLVPVLCCWKSTGIDQLDDDRRNNETCFVKFDDKFMLPKLRKLYYCLRLNTGLSTTATSCKYNIVTLPFEYHIIKQRIEDMSSLTSDISKYFCHSEGGH